MGLLLATQMFLVKPSSIMNDISSGVIFPLLPSCNTFKVYAKREFLHKSLLKQLVHHESF